MATEGILRIPKELPSDSRSWEQFTRRLNKAIQVSGNQAVLDTLTTLASRSGTDFDTMLSKITDAGRAQDQRFLNMITFGNVQSVQSAIPLTATADAISADIAIGAHTLYYGGETISFNAGSVSGLSVVTDYYVYADDPNLTGGAVTYMASTALIDVASSKDRYLVGAIRTPVSSISASVSAATQANPCAITTGAPHGMTTGDQVTFSGVVGMTQLNTLSATTIVVTGANSVTLTGVNSTAFGAYVSGGTMTRVSTPADGIGGAGASGYLYDLGVFYGA